ncbi:MAG: RecX family transcriptional regulator [Rhodospirillaceae bacterium]|jgi:regulatory protein|nr:RecX family transcriptional regulator [Rhodospirillaceae bacterium]MBT6137101.1 RecX family transcriptional regulator [Rhodospirillaceae bacterium]
MDTGNADSQQPQRQARRRPKKVTKARLERIAVHYLGRFSSSVENLRRVLTRRLDRADWPDEEARAEAEIWLAETVEKLVGQGLVSDSAYAEGRARSLHGQGRSRRRIAEQLRQKGVGRDAIEAALDLLVEETQSPDLDFAAASRLARRRRLGPYRAEEARAERRDRDLAALARSGFSYDVARRIIDAADTAELEDEAGIGLR